MERETQIITVVLADDHAVVLKGLQYFFQTAVDIKVVATAPTGGEAVEATRKHRPTVLLLDLLMPDQPAILTVKQAREASPATRIIILTSHEGGEYMTDLLEAGALSYLLKDSTPEGLLHAIRKAARGESILDARLAELLLEGINSENGELYIRLTDREREVTQLIARGLNNAEIAQTLFVSEATVKSHVSNILGKLYLGDRTKLAAYAWEQGFVKRGK
jgi:Response regulator containing a CheY-like receiver domain and an HTH DNA-binding domain